MQEQVLSSWGNYPKVQSETFRPKNASDLHKKNHHADACFSDHLIFIELVNAARQKIRLYFGKPPEAWAPLGLSRLSYI